VGGELGDIVGDPCEGAGMDGHLKHSAACEQYFGANPNART
jgi:hypothetical protein